MPSLREPPTHAQDASIPSRAKSAHLSTTTTKGPTPFLEVLTSILEMFFVRGKNISQITDSLSYIKDPVRGGDFFKAHFIRTVIGSGPPNNIQEAGEVLRQRVHMFNHILKMHNYGFDFDYIRDYLLIDGFSVLRELIQETCFYHELWGITPRFLRKC
ncbi:hypothetical protein MMC22_007094 [Lobaria immixta]|nr:hypothetical protein [Lobaria immixta]